MKKERIVVLGGGESGYGSAVLAVAKGYEVFLSDKNSIPEKYKKQLIEQGIDFEEGMHTTEKILNANWIIKSPGIPDTAKLIVEAHQKKIPVISEIEFAAKYTNAKMIGITGSNGKTTTTLLTFHLLQKAGLNVGLAGNIGKSFALQVATQNFDYYVLELSSFQLDNMYSFKADVAVLLNITPDHLDRYDYKMQNYVDSKFRIAQNQTAADYLIVNMDDEEIKKNIDIKKIQSTIIPISISKELEVGGSIKNEEINININHKSFNMTLQELALQGKHNAYNSMAAAITAKIFDVRNTVIREGLSDFKNVEHRLEHVAKVQGIEFINDSKATNVNSVWYALESMTSPVVLILGGIDKGNDYSILKDLVKQKVKAIVCLGKDNSAILKAFEGDVEIIVNTFSAKDAVQMAYHLAEKGDTVLLSPACSSFDLFKNYEDRGQQFKDAVKEL